MSPDDPQPWRPTMTNDELKELEMLQELEVLFTERRQTSDAIRTAEIDHEIASFVPYLLAVLHERDELRKWQKDAVRVLEYGVDNELSIDYWTPVARKLIAQAEQRKEGE